MAGPLQNLISGATGSLGQALERPQGSEAGDRDTFTENRFTSWHGGSLVGDQFSDLAVFSVPAQTGYSWGYGEPAPGKLENQGRLYADLQSATPNQSFGRVRLYSRKSTGKRPDGHGTFHSTELNQTLGDRTTWPFLPERDMPVVSEDSELIVRYELDTASSIDSDVSQSGSTIRINVTEFS